MAQRFGKDTLGYRSGDVVKKVYEMTDFAADRPAAFDRIVSPMIGRRAHRVDAIANRQRRCSAGKEILRGNRQGRKASIESHHQPAVCIAGSRQHIVQILILKREWFLDKHMLARSEGALRQFSMRAMARCDDNQVCRAVVDHFIRTRDSCAKTVLHSDFARGHTGRRCNRLKIYACRFELRQQNAFRVTTRADHSHANTFSRRRRLCRERNAALNHSSRVIREQDADVRFINLTRDELVSFLSSVEIETMRDQRLDIHAATGNEIEKGFDVAAFSPTYIREGVIVTALFVLRIIPTGATGFRNAERQLAIVESFPRDVQPNRANRHDASL